MIAGGSIRLFEFAGTTVRIHPTFFLLLVWVGAVYWFKGGPTEAVYGVVFILILFACVILHEFGHILMARRYGIETPDVTLLPIGGVASMERMPEKPAEEIAVALAGPAVNLAIALLLIGLFGQYIDVEKLGSVQHAPIDLLSQVAIANVALFVFNLIPAFPMDGGRVLRAALASSMEYARATRIAATIGQGIALFLGVLGLLGNPILILIALFIFLAASGEAGYVESKALTSGFTAKDAMITTYESLHEDQDLDAAVEKLLATTQQEFPVVDPSGRLRGVLTRENLIAALQEKGGRALVRDAMIADVRTVAETDSLGGIFEMLRMQEAAVVAVVGGERRLVGYINAENIAELLLVGRSRVTGPLAPQ